MKGSGGCVRQPPTTKLMTKAKQKKKADTTATPMTSVQGRLATGIEGLDNILEGGFPANRIYLIEGEPGTAEGFGAPGTS